MINRLKSVLPNKVKQSVKIKLSFFKAGLFSDRNSDVKIFCISIQRNGTTSVGDFLSDHGFHVARWRDSDYYDWPYLQSIGNFEAIFQSKAFKSFDAFEDGPWFAPDFYRVLYHRFPKSKFILFYRDSDRWFDSMLKYSNGKTLGNTYRHCKTYRRLSEYYDSLDKDPDFRPAEKETDNLLSLEDMREHYKRVYEEYNRDAIAFFKKYASDKLFSCHLQDPDKWKKLGNFLDIEVNDGYDVHSNKSKDKERINKN